MVHKRIKGTLSLHLGMEENNFILLVLCRNGVSRVPHRKFWISMSLGLKRSTIGHADLRNFPFSPTIFKKPLTLLTSWLLAIYARSLLYMANGMCMASQHSSARLNWSVVYVALMKFGCLMEISVITITE